MEFTCLAGRFWVSWLPWFGLIGLMGLPRNRRPSAGWILLPALAVFGLIKIFQATASSMSSDSLNMFSELIYAMGLGVAALWLTAGCWGEKNRFTRFLLSLLVLGGYGLFAWFSSSGGDDTLLLPACIFLGLSALLLSVSITISGRLGRGHQTISNLLLWLSVCLLTLSIAIILPFFLYARVASQGSVGWTEFLVSVTLLGGVNYAILLPFLLLSSANQHYRLRINEMLGWARETSPPVILIKPALFTQTVSPGNSPQGT